jgi:hypothetical protein
MSIDMIPVESGHIEAIGYDPYSEEMRIRFVGNHLYVYRGVPQEIWDQFRVAQSKGQFFAAHIKKQYVGLRLS